MSEGGKWTPAKVFLLVIGILAGLGILCCGAGYLLVGDKIRAVIKLEEERSTFRAQLRKDYGKTTLVTLAPNDRSEPVLAIGVEGDLTPERVIEIQDGAWKTFAATFGKDGYLPVKHLAIGKAVPGRSRGSGKVIEWSRNSVSVDELVKRTGVPAPPLAKFLPEDMEDGAFQVHVTEDDKGEEDDGAGSGGK